MSDRRTRARVVAVALGGVVGLYLTGYVVASLPRYPDTLRWFPAYLSWTLVGLFFASLVGIVWRRIIAARDPDVIALSVGFAVASIPVLYNPQLQDFGVHIGTMRRFVPFVIPAIVVVAAVGYAWLVGRLSFIARCITVPLGVVLVLALVAQPSMAVVGHRLWDNGVAESTELAAMFPPESVILVSPELAGVQVQAALTFWHGHAGVALNRSYAIEGLVEDQVTRWLQSGRAVFLLSAAPDLHFDGSDLSLTEHGSDELDLRTLAASSWLPYETEARQVRMTAYRFGLDLAPKTHVDVGSYVSDALFPLAGFYGAETDSVAGPYRWTGASASIEVPAARRITLVLRAARPPGIAPAVVSIRVNGRLAVESATVADQPTSVELDLGDLGLAGPVTITIESSTFNPRDAGLSGDDRDLGVRLYRVDLER